jgi:hypothetical protein
VPTLSFSQVLLRDSLAKVVLPLWYATHSALEKRLIYSSAGVLEWEVVTHSKLASPAYVCNDYNNYPVLGNKYNALSMYSHTHRTSIAPCTENSVRLVGGINQFNGRVEICKERSWAAVCKTGFGSNEARAVCGGLGLDTSTVFTTLGQIFQQPTADQIQTTYSLTASCNGDGAAATCNFTSIEVNSQCSETEKAGVFCPRNFTSSETKICNSGAVRLTGGSRKSEGRLEACLNNQWGTVCDDSWDNRATAIVCRQLGYQTQGWQ